DLRMRAAGDVRLFRPVSPPGRLAGQRSGPPPPFVRWETLTQQVTEEVQSAQADARACLGRTIQPRNSLILLLLPTGNLLGAKIVRRLRLSCKSVANPQQ